MQEEQMHWIDEAMDAVEFSSRRRVDKREENRQERERLH